MGDDAMNGQDKVYLDEQGNPIGKGKTYLDEQGNPIGQKIDTFLGHLFGGWSQQVGGSPVGQAEIGAVKNLVGQGYGIGHLLGLSRAPSEVPELQTQDGWQKTGAGIAEVAPYLLPMGAEEKAMAKAAELFPGLAQSAPLLFKSITRALVSGTSAGTIGTLQTGSPQQGMKVGLMAGGISGLGEAAVAPVMEAFGKKIQLSTIRPRVMDHIDNFKEGTLQRLGLKGNLSDSFKQVSDLITGKVTQRDAIIASGGVPGAVNQGMVDVGKAFDGARDELEKGMLAGKYGQDVINGFDKLRDDVYQTNLLGNPLADLKTAENIKERIGNKGLWSYGRKDPESEGMQIAANAVYGRMRQGIEDAVPIPGQLRSLNKEIQELIPLKNAMLARLPVEARNRLFSLSDIAATLPAAISGRGMELALPIASRLQKSLRFGNMLTRQAPNAPEATSGIGKILAAILAGQSSPPE
jgi:hypothetical protein